jgi:hypothetical protein
MLELLVRPQVEISAMFMTTSMLDAITCTSAARATPIKISRSGALYATLDHIKRTESS